MNAELSSDYQTHATIRARVLGRLGAPEAADTMLQRHLAAAFEDIRNALVPLQAIADLLQRQCDRESHGWCASILREEVKHILSILDGLSP